MLYEVITVNAKGEPILLMDQNRAKWDQLLEIAIGLLDHDRLVDLAEHEQQKNRPEAAAVV